MCGIMGYVGREEAVPVLLDGLRRLEYRGYDSAGVAVLGKDGVAIARAEGKLSRLEGILREKPISGSTGIGHTRWATHGRPSETNAHPHRAGDIVLVHNGIIENYVELKKMLVAAGHEFSSETDTEVVCHLIDNLMKAGKRTFDAILAARDQLQGSYSLVILNVREPGVIYIAKRGSPLVVGEGQNEKLVASDIPALLPYTRDMVFLEDGDCGIVRESGIELYDGSGTQVTRKAQRIPWNALMAERGGYKHFMLKEIFEQPTVLQDAMAGRLQRERGVVELPELESFFDRDKPLFDRVAIIACGTSYHAGMVGKYAIEMLARIPVSVDLASEFRYREPLIDKRTLIVSISQSGETADTLAAQLMAREQGAKVLAICNVVGSSITRSADATLYTHAGPEIGVASTKAFTAQLTVLYLTALALAHKLKSVEIDTLRDRLRELTKLPKLMQRVLDGAPEVKAIAEEIADATHVLYIGRGANYPVALEGALKLKEISYLHAEGFAAGELKHGPIALIDHDVPVVAITPNDALRGKIVSNIEEVRARGARVIAVANEGDGEVALLSKYVITIPPVTAFAFPILVAVPLQLLAYYVADHKGTDVDQPRNLAKSVTVE